MKPSRKLFIQVLFLTVLVCTSSAAQSDKLMSAYKKEYAFLEAEKRALKKRLDELEKNNENKIGQARSAVDQLQNRVLNMRMQAQDLEMELAEVEHENIRAEERKDLILETMDRAHESLRKHGFDLPAVSEDPEVQKEQLKTIFDTAVLAMRKNGQVRKGRGEYFRVDGQQTTGTMVHIGNIATYGVSPVQSGALAPAGAGRLKVWHQDAADTAQALASGQSPESLAIFLYETIEKGVEEKKEKTALDVIQSGGVIAWVIVCLGILAVIMMIVRVVILIRASSRADMLLHEVSDLVFNGLYDKAIEYCTNTPGAAARVLKATIKNRHRDREHLEDIVAEAILHEAPYIERFGATILVIAAVAPLLGLLGTVTGMISTFDVITEFGTGDPKMLSGGISEALVTTELGLIVAIPTLLFGTLLSGRASAILSTIERTALRVMNLTQLKNEQDKEPGIEQDLSAADTDAIKPTDSPPGDKNVEVTS